jgi:hypothetical protein
MYSVSNWAESIVTNTKLLTSQFQLPEMQEGNGDIILDGEYI